MTIAVNSKNGVQPEVMDFADYSDDFQFVQTVEVDGTQRQTCAGPWVKEIGDRPDDVFTKGLQHSVWGVDVGQDDNFRILIRWHHPRWYNYLGQIGPAAWLNPTARQYDKMGLSYVNDISIFGGAGYPLHVFRCPIKELMDSSYYTTILHPTDDKASLSHQAEDHPMGTDGEPYTEIEMTVRDGRYTVRWGDRIPVCNMKRPGFAKGKTFHGVHVIEITPWVGTPEWVWGEAISGVPGEVQGWNGEPVFQMESAMTWDIEVEVL